MEYTRRDEIGRGGYGVVYRAVGSDGIVYAIKLLDLSQSPPGQHEEIRKRFDREIRYQASVDHPNVVQIVDFNLDDPTPYYVMPLAVCTLRYEIDHDPSLGARIGSALSDIMSGLEALHALDLTHRDLKPENVLSYRTGSGGSTYKISDFGLVTPGYGLTTAITPTNAYGGTHFYAAPECLMSFRRATPRADIFSFGCILHDIFSPGQPRSPFTQINDGSSIGSVIGKCTEILPARRYRSIVQLRDALLHLLSTTPIVPQSKPEADIVSLLTSGDQLTDADWDKCYNVLENNDMKGTGNYAILTSLSNDHITDLFSKSDDMFHAIGEHYAKFAMSFSFVFEYCDVISDKAQVFYDFGDVRLKASIALAMLQLGTSHNRWRVERQFLTMAGEQANPLAMQRMIVEMQVQRLDFKSQIEHVERSIGRDRSELHPLLINYLDTLG